MAKKTSDYEKEYYGTKNRIRKPLLIISAILVAIVISLFMFYNDIGFFSTGNAIKIPTSEKSISTEIRTNIPDFKLNLKNATFSIDVLLSADLYIDDKIFSVNKPQSHIIFSNFDGELLINNKTISITNGKLSEINIDDFHISAKDGERMKIEIKKDETLYNYMNIETDSYIKELSFVGTGYLKTNTDDLILNEEKIVLNNLFGEIKIENDMFMFRGISSKISIDGKDKKISIKK